MALSTITANTSLGTTSPSNLKAAIGADVTTDRTPPAGYSVSLVGKLDNSNPGGYGMVFAYGVPAGVRVDLASGTGSMKVNSSNFNAMSVNVIADSNQRGSTVQYWEVWFNQTDVDSSGWSTQVTMNINGTPYNYTFTKRRTGDDL